MKRRKVILATILALALILHTYVYFTQLDFDSIMEQRRLDIQTYCVDDGFSSKKDTQVKNIMTVEEVSWCPVPGVHDEFYLKMLQLSGISTEEIEKLQLLYGPENLQDLSESQIAPQNVHTIDHAKEKNAKWLVIVAHPWIRLVSIYQSCYEKFNYNCFLKHGRLMLKNDSLVVTFEDFIEYVLLNPQVSQWRPATQLCQVCFRPYNYVLKSETIQTEEMYWWAKLGVVSTTFNYLVSRPTQTWENTEKYLHLLTQKQMDQVLRMYQSDFRAFGYSHLSA